jgi:hypothetical protein
MPNAAPCTGAAAGVLPVNIDGGAVADGGADGDPGGKGGGIVRGPGNEDCNAKGGFVGVMCSPGMKLFADATAAGASRAMVTTAGLNAEVWEIGEGRAARENVVARGDRVGDTGWLMLLQDWSPVGFPPLSEKSNPACWEGAPAPAAVPLVTEWCVPVLSNPLEAFGVSSKLEVDAASQMEEMSGRDVLFNRRSRPPPRFVAGRCLAARNVPFAIAAAAVAAVVGGKTKHRPWPSVLEIFDYRQPCA